MVSKQTILFLSSVKGSVILPLKKVHKHLEKSMGTQEQEQSPIQKCLNVPISLIYIVHIAA